MKDYCYKYPRPSYTVDAAIFAKQDRKILLILRKHDPFAGSWAFPGGFMDMDETPEEAIIRELEEETYITGIKLKQFKTYGALGRDPRGRTISTLFIGFVKHSSDIKPKGGDDAAEARWFNLEDIPELAFDHGIIFTELLNSLNI
ncbi:MAG: NUDIX hydrolase [Bacteroidales bacterium]|nr:NUDIX hydrolase [Bacteroidales bacterium]